MKKIVVTSENKGQFFCEFIQDSEGWKMINAVDMTSEVAQGGEITTELYVIGIERLYKLLESEINS